jgi:hypothetical protein
MVQIEYVTGELSDTQISLRVGYAMRGRLSSLCSHIMKSITLSTRMIDELPAAAIEAMIEYAQEQQRMDRAATELDKAYKQLRADYIQYGKIALKEARARERRLPCGDLTGEDIEEAARKTDDALRKDDDGAAKD